MTALVQTVVDAAKRAGKRMREFFVLPRHRVYGLLSCVALVIIVSLLRPSNALAADPTVAQRIAYVLADILYAIAGGIGTVISGLISILVAIVTYNSFSTSQVVSQGWAIVRDSINMFYVILLIIIAFGTIINWTERFQWKQQIPKLLVWAIIINFSKTLCGLAIDASQVFTLTFANAIKDIAGGNFVTAFGLNNVLSVSQAVGFSDPTQQTPLQATDYLFSGVAAVVMFLIVLGVIVMLIGILLFRIVMLWILIVVSPLTWFTNSIKGIIHSSAYTDWWDQFKCFLVVGPVLTFFLWLALAVAGSGSVAATENFTVSNTNPGIMNTIFDAPRLTSFIIAIAIIWAGIDQAQHFCAHAKGGLVQKALGKAQSFAKGAALAPLQFGKGAALGVGSRIPLVGARGIGLNRNQVGKSVVRGLQTVTRNIPGVLGGAALTEQLGKANEYFEASEHHVNEADIKRKERAAKAFATDQQKMDFMKEAGNNPETSRFSGNKDAIMGNLKRAIDDKAFRKTLEDAGVDVGGLLQAYDKDISHTYYHDPKDQETYKKFKKENASMYIPTEIDPVTKQKRFKDDALKGTFKSIDDLKEFDWKSVDWRSLKKRDDETAGQFTARQDGVRARAAQIEDFMRRPNIDPVTGLANPNGGMGDVATGEVDKDGKPLSVYDMARQGKLTNPAKIVVDDLARNAPTATLVTPTGTFANEQNQKDLVARIERDLKLINSDPAVNTALTYNGGDNAAASALIASLAKEDYKKMAITIRDPATSAADRAALQAAAATLEAVLRKQADLEFDEKKQKELDRQNDFLRTTILSATHAVLPARAATPGATR